jgi:hypothetical protein
MTPQNTLSCKIKHDTSWKRMRRDDVIVCAGFVGQLDQ